nr:hypothetical protein BaRGS_021488 [Batillaria attramentaria]
METVVYRKKHKNTKRTTVGIATPQDFAAIFTENGMIDSDISSSDDTDNIDQTDSLLPTEDDLWSDKKDAPLNLGVMHFADDYLDGIPNENEEVMLKRKHKVKVQTQVKANKGETRKQPLSRQQAQQGGSRAKPGNKAKGGKDKQTSTNSQNVIVVTGNQAGKSGSGRTNENANDIGTYPLSLNEGTTTTRGEQKLAIDTDRNTENLASDLEERLRVVIGRLLSGKGNAQTASNEELARQLHQMVMKKLGNSMSNLKSTEQNIMRAENILLASLQSLRTNLKRLVQKTTPRMQRRLLHQLEASMRNATNVQAFDIGAYHCVLVGLNEVDQSEQDLGKDEFMVSEHMPWLKILAVLLLLLILILVIVSVSMCIYYRIQDHEESRGYKDGETRRGV